MRKNFINSNRFDSCRMLVCRRPTHYKEPRWWRGGYCSDYRRVSKKSGSGFVYGMCSRRFIYILFRVVYQYSALHSCCAFCMNRRLRIAVFVNEIQIQGKKQKVEGKKVNDSKQASFHKIGFSKAKLEKQWYRSKATPNLFIKIGWKHLGRWRRSTELFH